MHSTDADQSLTMHGPPVIKCASRRPQPLAADSAAARVTCGPNFLLTNDRQRALAIAKSTKR